MRKKYLLLILLLFSLSMAAQDDSRLKFKLVNDNFASVSAQNEDVDGDIIIPSKVLINGKEYTVSAIADEGFKFTKITSITLPSTIEVIGNSAFFRCLSLKDIVLPPSVKNIGNDAFYNCSSLEGITLQGNTPPYFDMSDDVQTFDESAFKNAVVHVPERSLEAYRSSESWSKFRTIMKTEEDNSTEWHLITDNNELFNMNMVGMLVAADDSQYFSVLDLYGNILAENVLRIHFQKIDPTSVKNITVDKPQNMLKSYVKNKLILVGVRGTVNVYSVSGIKVSSTQAMNQETIIDVSALSEGTYIIKCGKQSFKFNKK